MTRITAVFVTFALLLSCAFPTFAQKATPADTIPACTAADLRAFASTVTGSGALQDIIDLNNGLATMASTERGNRQYLTDVIAARALWYDEVLPIVPRCAAAVDLSIRLSRWYDNMLGMAALTQYILIIGASDAAQARSLEATAVGLAQDAAAELEAVSTTLADLNS